MPRERILILHNEPTLPLDHRDAESEHAILDTVADVGALLNGAGYSISRLGVARDCGAMLNGIRQFEPDAVFNLFEGLPDWGDTEAYCIGLLEWLGVPFTGCPLQPACLARNKPLAKTLFRGAGLPTPEFFLIGALPVPTCPLPWPVIVKPSNQDASVGVDQGSVVTDQAALEERVSYILAEFGGPVLVEEFIPGREFNVAVVETPDLRVLPYSEIQFTRNEPGAWPIVTYDAKWRPGTPDYDTTPPIVGPALPPGAKERIDELALRAYRLLGCRDYARIDFRFKPPASPYILEVNPNPDLSSQACMSGALAAGGLPWDQFVLNLVTQALARGKSRAVRAGQMSIIR